MKKRLTVHTIGVGVSPMTFSSGKDVAYSGSRVVVRLN
jgi:hypothetical protein